MTAIFAHYTAQPQLPCNPMTIKKEEIFQAVQLAEYWGSWYIIQ